MEELLTDMLFVLLALTWVPIQNASKSFSAINQNMLRKTKQCLFTHILLCVMVDTIRAAISLCMLLDRWRNMLVKTIRIFEVS